MNTTIIEIIEISSILIGAVLGILGTATKTKNINDKLTRWGKIAIAGIIISNSFTLINNYFKHKNDESVEKLAQQKELEQLTLQKVFQDSLLQKMNKSLNSQIEIQNRTDALLHSSSYIDLNLKKNLEKQTELLYGQNAIIDKQAAIESNVHRTLNPFFPFTLSYSIKVPILNSQENRNELYGISRISLLIDTINNLYDSHKIVEYNNGSTNFSGLYIYKGVNGRVAKINGDDPYAFDSISGLINTFEGDYRIDNILYKKDSEGNILLQNNKATVLIKGSKTTFLITPDFSSFINFTNPIELELCLYKNKSTSNLPYPDFRALAKTVPNKTSSYLSNPDIKFNKILIQYNYHQNYYIISFYADNIEITHDNGFFKSFSDLKNNYLFLNIKFEGLPDESEFDSFSFFFPPQFSRNENIVLLQKGIISGFYMKNLQAINCVQFN